MGMNFTTLTTGIIVMSLVALGLGGLFSDMGTRYGVSIDSSYTNTYNKIQEIQNITEEINQEVIGDSSTSSTSSEALFQQGQSAVVLSYSGLGLIGALMQDGAAIFGVPAWFIGGIMAIILVSLAFLLFTVFLRAYKSL